jgi:hypothetical protein
MALRLDVRYGGLGSGLLFTRPVATGNGAAANQ